MRRSAEGGTGHLTRQVGLGSVSDYVTGIQAEVYTTEACGVQVYLGHDVAPGFFSWLVPTHPDRALVGLLTRRKAKSYAANFMQRLQREQKIGGVLKEPSSWGIPLRPLKRTYRDRVIVVGDAAGQVKPTTGGGIYYSLLSSEIAADVLSGALASDDLSASNLRDYQSQWKALLARELDLGYSLRRSAEGGTGHRNEALTGRLGQGIRLRGGGGREAKPRFGRAARQPGQQGIDEAQDSTQPLVVQDSGEQPRPLRPAE